MRFVTMLVANICALTCQTCCTICVRENLIDVANRVEITDTFEHHLSLEG